MKRVLVVIGTRPEAIKMAPVIRALRAHPQDFDIRVCASGQHRELLSQTVEAFGYALDYSLGVMTNDQSLSGLTSRLLECLDAVMVECRPDLVLVQGDTTTAFGAALIAHYQRREVGHVEAGLRTYNKKAPFPEETNRRLVGVLADHHFAPTPGAKEALLREGVDEPRILVTGNTVIDALLMALERVRIDPPTLGALDRVIDGGRKIVLITGHRRENFGHGFREICKGLLEVARAFPDVALIYPVHLNPNVRGPVHDLLGGTSNVYLVPPMGYMQFVRLMDASYLILTDSGGIQEEAPSLGKPVLVMREVTERPEAVRAGTARLVGCSSEAIFREASLLLTSREAYEDMRKAANPYGDGKAAIRITEYLRRL
jgi:UDP-N-acetylglucosamine 2-epimerase (non-hydrolysing)